MTQLERIYPSDAAEADARESMMELLASSADPFSRYRYAPGHFTAGAIAVADGHMLLIHHRRLEIWIEPGGHIDPSDSTPQEAAAREMFEETGVDAELAEPGLFGVDRHPIPAAAGEPDHHHFNLTYLFTGGKQPLEIADEIRDARWVPLGEVATLSHDPAVLRAVSKLEGRYRL